MSEIATAENPMLRMSNAEYTATQQRLLLLAMFATNPPLDLEAFIDRIRYTESTAPFIDPSRYLEGAKNLDAVHSLARAAVAFRKAAEEFVKATGIKP